MAMNQRGAKNNRPNRPVDRISVLVMVSKSEERMNFTIFRYLWQTTLFSELQEPAASCHDATWANCNEPPYIVVKPIGAYFPTELSNKRCPGSFTEPSPFT
jgi:hypothetical protein